MKKTVMPHNFKAWCNKTSVNKLNYNQPFEHFDGLEVELNCWRTMEGSTRQYIVPNFHVLIQISHGE